MRHYAKRLDVTMSTQVFATDADAMAAVKTGKADIALTNGSDYQNLLDIFNRLWTHIVCR